MSEQEHEMTITVPVVVHGPRPNLTPTQPPVHIWPGDRVTWTYDVRFVPGQPVPVRVSRALYDHFRRVAWTPGYRYRRLRYRVLTWLNGEAR